MKKLLLSIFALCAVIMSASATKIYVNPGHGSWTSECRNMLLINYPSYGDTLGFWESNTNLWKGLYLEKKLKESGFTVKMSRRYSGGASSDNYGAYDKALHVIAQEANSWGPNYFISIHSNAHQDGAVTNYPLFIHRGWTNSETCSGSIWGERILWPHHYEIFLQGQENNSYPNYNNNNKNIQGGQSMNGWDYGVLCHSYPGTLVEGYFHTYQPARHRAMQPDWCRQEGLRYWRGFTEMYGTAKDTKGYIMGYIRTKDKQINQTHYSGRSANDIYYPINGARVVLRNAKGELIKTDPYKYVARDFVSQAIYTTDNYYNGVFVYDDLAPGKYKIYVHCKGYKDLVQEVTVTAHTTTYTQIFVTAGTGTEPNTAPTLDPDVKWVLNGGIVPGGKVPTNAELWEEFKPYYNTYYGLSRADQPIENVSTFAPSLMQKIMTDSKSSYKWLGDYILSVVTTQGVSLSTDMNNATEAAWRWAVHAFFNAAAGQHGAAGADFTTAGKPAAWGDAYRVAKNISADLPYTITGDYTIPTPVKTGYDFLGWYDQNSTSGTKYTKLTKGWKGTLYALWQETPKGDVIWVLNGGSVNVTLPNYIENNPYTLPTPIRTGYVFLGWYDNAKGEGTPLTSLPVGFKGSVYAIWREAKVTWELNGGELPKAATVPTNDSLWQAFMVYYRTYYNETRYDQPITAASTFMTQACNIMTKGDSEYKWLGDYIYKVSIDQGVHLSINAEGEGVEALWRWTVHCFFNCTKKTDWPGPTADYSTAGKPEKWGPNYQAKYGQGVTLPTKITAAYTIPTPTKNGTTFVGWYDTNNNTGNKLTVLPVGYDGTVYAIWNDMLGDVTWELNGGKVSVTLPNKIEGSAYTLPTPTKDGYVFVGWYDNAKGEGTALTSLPVGYKGTVYAIWREAKVTWVLNGGKVVKEVTTTTPGKDVKVPTQEELWASYKTAAGLTTLGTLEEIKTTAGTNPHNDANAPCACRVICAKLTADMVQAAFGKAEWKWLQTYIAGVQTALAETALTEAAWRYAIAAFFVQSEHNVWPATANFADAGKPEKWGAAYQKANGGTEGETTTELVEVELPSKITAPYEIPTPVKDNDEFVGWYDTNDNTGTKLTVLPVGYDGTVYAIWKSMLTPTSVENVRPALNMDAPMYDVLGRQVDATYRGIIIQNGHKYILR